jgi:hypothetical protein
VARIISGLILIATRCDVRWFHYCKTQQSLYDKLAEGRHHRFPHKLHVTLLLLLCAGRNGDNVPVCKIVVTSNSINLSFKPYNRRRPTNLSKVLNQHTCAVKVDVYMYANLVA